MSVKHRDAVYHPLVHDSSDENLILVDQPPDSIRKQNYKLNQGVSCAGWFPENVLFEMSEDRGKVLSDSVENNSLLLIVSQKLKEFLESHAKEWIEFLPVGILDHEKQPIEAPYYIANVLRTLPCMDEARSDFVPSALDKTQVHHIKRLVLDVDQIPEDAKIFRLGQERDLILVRSDLAEAIKSAGMTGIQFVALEDYGEQYREVDRVEWAKRLLSEE